MSPLPTFEAKRWRIWGRMIALGAVIFAAGWWSVGRKVWRVLNVGVGEQSRFEKFFGADEVRVSGEG